MLLMLKEWLEGTMTLCYKGSSYYRLDGTMKLCYKDYLIDSKESDAIYYSGMI